MRLAFPAARSPQRRPKSMCRLAFIGAQTDLAGLRGVLSDPDVKLDVSATSDPVALRCFPDRDSVVRVTLGGCSCTLLRGLGASGTETRDAHFAGPGYFFRRALAAATLRFGSVRLLTCEVSATPSAETRRVVPLVHFLRSGLAANDELVFIVA